jgi:hypothetical protein
VKTTISRRLPGLYMSPPDNALVLAVDEKSQMQAIDRTAPILPVMPTTPARMTHDYVRHGTTSLFAAFDVGSASVRSNRRSQHRNGHGSERSTHGLSRPPACLGRPFEVSRCAPPRVVVGP